MARTLHFLFADARSHGGFHFPFPFEHYPYEPCKVQWSSLYDEPTLISHIVDVWQSDGLPQNFPLFVTELNIAWNTGESFVDIFGALWLADSQALTSPSGRRALLFPLSSCRSLSWMQWFDGNVWTF